MKKNGFLSIGKIIGVHGLKGTIKVYSYAESLSVFRPDALILIRNTKGLEKTYAIEWVKPHKRTYYWFDIIGLSVFTIDEKYLGCVESIIQTGSNDVYVVKDPNKDKDNEILIPALKSVVLAIDLERKIMRVDLPEGL